MDALFHFHSVYDKESEHTEDAKEDYQLQSQRMLLVRET